MENLVAKYWRMISLASFWVIIHVITVAFSALFLYSISLRNRLDDLHNLFRYLGKKHFLTLYFFNVDLKSDAIIWNSLSLHVEEDRSGCFFGLNRFMLNLPSRSPVGYRALLHTPLSSVHRIWLDCCSGNRCNVTTDFIMIKWGEKNRTKEHIPVSTCNLETETVSCILWISEHFLVTGHRSVLLVGNKNL